MNTTTKANDLTPLPVRREGDTQYFSYTCSRCGKDTTNSYHEPTGSRMLAARHCFHCDDWAEQQLRMERDHDRMTIIGGRIYGPGSRTSGSFRGMAGRRFDIEFIEPSRFAGKRITTFDLWAGGDMPDDLREKFPDTAKFLGGAHEALVGDTACWNPSDRRAVAYPLPNTLDLA